MFAKFVELPTWQVPLIIVGLVLVIALPSMFIAALKLSAAHAGALLEGNGWAINGRVKINIPIRSGAHQGGHAPGERAALP